MSTEQAFICPSCQCALQRATARLYACKDCRIVAAIYEEEGNALIISSPAGASTTLPLTALEG